MPMFTLVRPQAAPSCVRRIASLASVGVITAGALLGVSQPASAGIVPTVLLATAADYSVIGATTVTNTNPSVIGQSVGLSPGTAVVGFPPGIVLPPATIQAANAVTLQAQADLAIAYDDAAGRPVEFPNTNPDLVGLTLEPGVYSAAAKAPLALSGQLVLDGLGNPDAVFIFQTDSTLITSTGSTIALINGASECNVFWQVGSSATLGSGSLFVGNILALTSVTVESSVVVRGRAMARTGAVTLDNNVFTAPSCVPSTDLVPVATAPSTTTTTTTTTPPAPTTAAPVVTTTPAASGTTVAPGDTSAAPATTSAPTATVVGNTIGVGIGTTTTTVSFNVTDITLPATGAGETSTSIAAGAAVGLGALALLVARRRRPV